MGADSSFRVVIDPNVVFEGLTKQGGAAGLVIDAPIQSRALEMEDIKSILSEQLDKSVRDYSTRDFGRDKYFDAVSVIVSEESARSQLEKIRKVLPAGALAFIGTTRNLSNEEVNGHELVVILSKDKFDILRAAASDGINYDLTTEKIIEKLKAWDRDLELDIWQAESDTIQMKVQSLPGDLQAFGEEIYEFCPDIVDQGSGDVEDILEYLKSEKAIYLWWD
ncbi:DUF4253 domain-containing protein [Leptothoe sp. EHU-05/26/07-4]